MIKLHPFEEKQYESPALNLPESAVLVKTDIFNNNAVSLYDILNLFDCLVTDYSSIYFDYLLLDRPMIFVDCDLGEYKKARGLVFNDYNFWTPGPKVKTFSDFCREFKTCLENNFYYHKERNLINKLINENLDNNSSKRVLDSVVYKTDI